MNKLYIYGAITLGSLIGAYVPVVLFNSDPFGLASVGCGILGSFIGLYIGFQLIKNYGE